MSFTTNKSTLTSILKETKKSPAPSFGQWETYSGWKAKGFPQIHKTYPSPSDCSSILLTRYCGLAKKVNGMVESLKQEHIQKFALQLDTYVTFIRAHDLMKTLMGGAAPPELITEMFLCCIEIMFHPKFTWRHKLNDLVEFSVNPDTGEPESSFSKAVDFWRQTSSELLPNMMGDHYYLMEERPPPFLAILDYVPYPNETTEDHWYTWRDVDLAPHHETEDEVLAWTWADMTETERERFRTHRRALTGVKGINKLAQAVWDHTGDPDDFRLMTREECLEHLKGQMERARELLKRPDLFTSHPLELPSEEEWGELRAELETGGPRPIVSSDLTEGAPFTPIEQSEERQNQSSIWAGSGIPECYNPHIVGSSGSFTRGMGLSSRTPAILWKLYADEMLEKKIGVIFHATKLRHYRSFPFALAGLCRAAALTGWGPKLPNGDYEYARPAQYIDLGAYINPKRQDSGDDVFGERGLGRSDIEHSRFLAIANCCSTFPPIAIQSLEEWLAVVKRNHITLGILIDTVGTPHSHILWRIADKLKSSGNFLPGEL